MPFTIANEVRKHYQIQLAQVNPAASIRDLPGPLPTFDAFRFPKSV